MDGSFVNRTPAGGAAGGASGGASIASSSNNSNNRDNSSTTDCSASVAEASVSSVSSMESSPAVKSSLPLRGSEILAIPNMESSSTRSVGGEPPKSPSTNSVEVVSTNSSGEYPTPPLIEPINPFDQVPNSASSGSESSRKKPLDSSMTESNFSGNNQQPTEPSTPAPGALSPEPAPITPQPSANPLIGSPLDAINTEPRSTSPTFSSSLPMHSASLVAGAGGFLLEDDDTEPSSAVTSSNPGDPASSTDGQDTATLDSDPSHKRNNSISRFFENTRRRIGSTRKDSQLDDDKGDPAEHIPDVDDDLLGDNVEGTLICGYLQKLGRNGKWQTRWFETDGECLSYYKSEKRTKVLATLDLEKVGSILIDPEDSEGVSFNIQVLGRLYHLRADSKASCKDWVITLNRVKEARMQQGNVKLVSMPFKQATPVDLLDNTPAQSDDFVAPRVVVLANRQRTRAVEEENELNQLIRLEENADLEPEGKFKSEKRLSTIGTVVLARWTKRKSSLSRLRSKLAKWARSLRKLNCSAEGAVGLDSHVHPPGHDDKRRSKHGENSSSNPPPPLPPSSSKKTKDMSTWIGKEASITSRSPPAPGGMTPSVDPPPAETRHHRKNSSMASEDIRVLS